VLLIDFHLIILSRASARIKQDGFLPPFAPLRERPEPGAGQRSASAKGQIDRKRRKKVQKRKESKI
jgi:hypothetical protein